MRILAILSTLDLKFGLGCTPAWWQLLKALYENDNDILAIPYLGNEIESLWWKTSKNPTRTIGNFFFSMNKIFFPKGTGKKIKLREKMIMTLSKSITLPIWKKYLKKTIRNNGPFDFIIFFNIPLNQIKGLAKEIKYDFGLNVVYYDGDMPSILPDTNYARGFIFNYYIGADLFEYDLFFVNSEGVIDQLKQMGARNVKPLHYAADPTFYKPVESVKKWDVAYFGYGSKSREHWIKTMIADPSVRTSIKFVVGGEGFTTDFGNSQLIGTIPVSGLNRFCGSAKINLNLTASTHANVYASSTARPFELAAMGCCIVSCPYKGLDKWFDNGREMVILEEHDNVIDVYQELLSDQNYMNEIGKNARDRVLRDHTYNKRAFEMLEEINRL